MTERAIDPAELSSCSQETDKPLWKEELFYFGNASWPSDRTYRRFEERMQVKVEKFIPLQKTENYYSYSVGVDKKPVYDFISNYSDCEILVFDGYQPREGDYRQPSLYIVGWEEVTSEEGRKLYFQDKLGGGKWFDFTLEDVSELVEAIDNFGQDTNNSITLHYLQRFLKLEIVNDNSVIKEKVLEVISKLSVQTDI